MQLLTAMTLINVHIIILVLLSITNHYYYQNTKFCVHCCNENLLYVCLCVNFQHLNFKNLPAPTLRVPLVGDMTVIITFYYYKLVTVTGSEIP